MADAFVTKVTVLQILLTPLTMGLTLCYLLGDGSNPPPWASRSPWLGAHRPGHPRVSHLRRHPVEVLLLRCSAVVILVALPIKLYALSP